MNQLGELKGKELMCHCGPTSKCHGDVLIRLFEEVVLCRTLPAAFHVTLGPPGPSPSSSRRLGGPSTLATGPPPVVDAVRRAIFWTLTHRPEELRARRRARLAMLRCKAAELEAQERALRERLDPGVRQVLGDKRLLLLEWVLREVGHEDSSFVKSQVSRCWASCRSAACSRWTRSPQR